MAALDTLDFLFDLDVDASLATPPDEPVEETTP
jgi:hypothetical protein